MKFSKSLLWAFAGLGLFACSNEEVVPEGGSIQKNGATVTVKFIGDAISRTVETPTIGETGTTYPVVVKSGSITLIAQAVDVDNESQSITGTLNSNSVYTFTGVRVPESIEVVINEGIAGNMALASVYNTGLAEPLYGKETTFSQDASGNYTVTINLTRRLARLQFSGLDFETVGSSYTALMLDGIYLNGAAKTEKGTDYATENNANAWTTVSTTWGIASPVFDAIGEVVIGSGAVDGPWPAAVEGQAKCFAYNIFPASGTNLPKLTVCFSGAVQTGVTSATDKRYARVSKYVISGDKGSLEGIADDGTITDFKAGYIYNITGLELKDGDLGTTPDGGKDVQLVATVTVDPWTLVNATVEW